MHTLSRMVVLPCRYGEVPEEQQWAISLLSPSADGGAVVQVSSANGTACLAENTATGTSQTSDSGGMLLKRFAAGVLLQLSRALHSVGLLLFA